jgi:hypothetical protein
MPKRTPNHRSPSLHQLMSIISMYNGVIPSMSILMVGTQQVWESNDMQSNTMIRYDMV